MPGTNLDGCFSKTYSFAVELVIFDIFAWLRLVRKVNLAGQDWPRNLDQNDRTTVFFNVQRTQFVEGLHLCEIL